MPLSDIRALLDLLPGEEHPIYRRAVEACDALELEAALRDAGIRADVEPRALPDYLRRGVQVFKVEGGSIVPTAPRWSRGRPQEALSVDEWAMELRTEAAHLFRKR